jgi:hypothetical protein
MNIVLIAAFSIGAIFDGFTTYCGIAAIVEAKSAFTYAFSAGFALLILALGINTKGIRQARGGFRSALAVVWVVAILVDVYTSLMGNFAYVAFDKSYSQVAEYGVIASFKTVSGSKSIIVILGTLFFCLSPIYLSYLLGPSGGTSELQEMKHNEQQSPPQESIRLQQGAAYERWKRRQRPNTGD